MSMKGSSSPGDGVIVAEGVIVTRVRAPSRPMPFHRVTSLRVFPRQALDPAFLSPHVWYGTQFDHRSGKLTGACLARLLAYKMHVDQGGSVTVELFFRSAALLAPAFEIDFMRKCE